MCKADTVKNQFGEKIYELDSLRERFGAFTVWRQPSEEAKALMNHLLPDPDQVISGGQAVSSPWRSEATDKAKVVYGEKTYFLKRYNCTGMSYRLKNTFRPSRALRSWRAAEQFKNRHVQTLPPLLCLEERRMRLLGRSYILFPFLGDAAGSLLECWPLLTATQREDALKRLGSAIGGMHRAGLLHGDLNWRNIMVVTEGDRLTFYPVDLDGSRWMYHPRLDLAKMDLDHFLRDLKRSGEKVGLRTIFLDSWRIANGFTDQ